MIILFLVLLLCTQSGSHIAKSGGLGIRTRRVSGEFRLIRGLGRASNALVSSQLPQFLPQPFEMPLSS